MTFARLVNGRVLVAALVTTAVLTLLANLPVLPVSAPVIAERSGGVRILDVAPQPDPGAVYAAVARYDRARYLWEIFTVDLVLPLAYGAAFALAVLLMLRRVAPARPGLRRLAALPLVTALVDYAENASIATLLIAHPDRLDPVARAQIALTAAKNVGLVASVALFLVVLAAWAVQALTRGGGRQRTIPP